MAQLSALPSDAGDINWLSPDVCNALCEQTQIKWNNVEEELELARDKLMRTQKEFVMQELMRMMKDVKKLTVEEFDEKFGCDIIGIIDKQFAAGNVNPNCKKRNIEPGLPPVPTSLLSLKTPAHRFGKPNALATRTARKGERVISYSENGSPIDQYDQGEMVITAKKRRAMKGVTPFPVSIGIGAGNGQCIDLSDPNERNKLDENQKAQAMEQLIAMQEQMKNLMADW